MKTQPGFGRHGKTKVPYQKLFDEYVDITTGNGDMFFGKYSGISEEGNMILNPHIAHCFAAGFREFILIEQESYLHIDSIKNIKPATRQRLEEYCKAVNLSSKRNFIEEEKKHQETAKE